MTANTITARTLRAAVAAAAILSWTPGTANAAAPVDEGGGSATYNCLGDYDQQAAPTPVTFGLISPPSSARPGDTLSLSGNLGITLSSGDAQESKLLLAKSAKIDATDFNLVVKAGDKTLSLKPTSVISTPAPIKTPFTLTADVSYPDVTIPASAAGAVIIEMPLARATSTKVRGAPAKVTFTARLSQDSPLVPSRNVACWAEKLGDTKTIAHIPLTTSASSPVANSTLPLAASPLSGAGSAPVPAAAFAPPPSAVEPPLSAPVAAAPGTTTPARASAGTLAAAAPIPPTTVSSRTFIPGWILALFIAVLPIAGLAYAVAQRRRFHRLHATTTPAA